MTHEFNLVTGASGFIGGALVKRLLGDGAAVRGLVRSAEKGAWVESLGAEVAIGDLRDSDAVRRAVQGCMVVFHVAAATGGPEALQHAVNVTAAGRLVELACEAGVHRLVHVSTIANYGYEPLDVVTEETPLRPGREFYAESKTAGERQVMARAAALGLPVTVIRPGMVYGPRSGFWTGVMFNLARRRFVLLPGDGTTYCPAIHIDDVVDLLVTVAEHPRAVGEVFNAAPDPPPTWRQFFGAYAAMAGHQNFLLVPIWLLRVGGALAELGTRLSGEPQPVRGMVAALMARRRVYSMDKAARLLDWRPQVSLADGMVSAEAWLRETGRLS